MSYFSQTGYDVRLEWGEPALRHLAADVDCIVIIDVMSFSTCVSIAVDRGALVYPYPMRGDASLAYGAAKRAEVAGRRCDSAKGRSLSPQSMLEASQDLRLVLPSPNGSACCYHAKGLGKAVYSACFRNLQATARACRAHGRILLVPCGERWPDDNSLRPSLEDYLAAGGIVSALQRESVSPEARAAALAYAGLGALRDDAIRACGSAIELTERGFETDVLLCLAHDASNSACRMEGDHFVAA